MEKYINRELSWLDFNFRVLEEANCETNPLLERVKFLAISASNLDEFFMVRVGGLKLVIDSEQEATGINGLSAEEQLGLIRKKVGEMNAQQALCFSTLERELALNGIHRSTADDISDEAFEYLQDYFDAEIFSALTPIAIDAQEPFPMLAGTSVCLAMRVESDPDMELVPNLSGDQSDRESGQETYDNQFLVVPFRQSLPRIIPLPADAGYRYVFLEDVVALFADRLVGNRNVIELTPFRLTRNADVRLADDEASDLLQGMEKLLEARKTGGAVRLELAGKPSNVMSQFLLDAMDVSQEDVYPIAAPLDFSSLFALAGISGFTELKNEPWPPQQAPAFHNDRTYFETIAEADQLLIHPYQSYDPVVTFIQQAAADPDVIAIKQTLYRTSRDSQIAQALESAAEAGKHVTAIVELKARFDEARNINWAKRLEQSGVDVIYGVRGLKTHAKICIVVRREPGGIQRYLHVGTGNYNESTARLYSDISLFTSNEQLGLDAVHFFNAITGLSLPQPLLKLAAAPINLRESLLNLIDVEIENAQKGNPAGIRAKINSLVDREMIDALYRAGQAGVKVELNVRGICCLRAGVRGLSENIRVVSIVDRLLEHSRVFSFIHGGSERVYISSADWMNRNLDRRVELMTPIRDPKCLERMKKVLNFYFRDNVKARQLCSDNQYRPVSRSSSVDPFRCQERLYEESRELYNKFTNPHTTVFKPHRGETA